MTGGAQSVGLAMEGDPCLNPHPAMNEAHWVVTIFQPKQSHRDGRIQDKYCFFVKHHKHRKCYTNITTLTNILHMNHAKKRKTFLIPVCPCYFAVF